MKARLVVSLLVVYMYAFATGTKNIRMTVMNNFKQFNQKWKVGFDGKTLYDAMVTLENKDPTFSFASEPYPNLGQFVVSMCHMVACDASRQYWSILGPDGRPIKQGVSTTYPENNDNYTFNMTLY